MGRNVKYFKLNNMITGIKKPNFLKIYIQPQDTNLLHSNNKFKLLLNNNMFQISFK